MKCQLCRKNEAVWSMQYIAEDKPTFAVPGWHYRGFKVTKVCDECQKVIEEKGYTADQVAANMTQPTQTQMFETEDLPLFSGTPGRK